MKRSAVKQLIYGFGLALTLLLSGPSWAFGPQSLGAVSLIDVSPRIITPNGDNRNDKVFFRFDDVLTGLPVDSGIFDINGAKVADLTMTLNDTALTWDGRDEGGRNVPSGVYVYSIHIGKTVNGTIVVAK